MRKAFSLIGSLLLAMGTSLLRAQEMEPPPPPARSGFQILNLSGYGVYYSSSLPLSSYQPGAPQLLSDVGGGGSAGLGWMKFGERSSFSFVYTPSYTARARYSEWNALNHAASLSVITHPAPRWSLGLSFSGDYSSLDQFLFSPTPYGAAAAAPGSFDALAAAVLTGQFNTPQIASIFTTAPTAQSPIRSLLYGQRMFTVGGQTSLSYLFSPRLSFVFTGNAVRNQHVQDNGPAASASTVYLLAHTTSGGGSASFNYSVSPLTQIGASITVRRTVSTIYDAYNSTAMLTLGRTFARRWFLQGRGGAGLAKPMGRSTPGSLSATAHPVGGGSIGFRTFSHTLLASFDRTVSDSYGTAAATGASAGGTWRWSRPGRSWWVETGGGWGQLQENATYNISGWLASISVGRTIGAHTTLLTQYVYLNYDSRLTGSVGQSAVRFSIVWTPTPGMSR